LQHLEEFSELSHALAYLCNQFLRISAQVSDTEFFYEGMFIDHLQTQTPVLLQLKEPDSEIKTMFQKACGTLLDSDKHLSRTVDLTENPLLEKMVERNKNLKAIDYFLIHYHGQG